MSLEGGWCLTKNLPSTLHTSCKNIFYFISYYPPSSLCQDCWHGNVLPHLAQPCCAALGQVLDSGLVSRLVWGLCQLVKCRVARWHCPLARLPDNKYKYKYTKLLICLALAQIQTQVRSVGGAWLTNEPDHPDVWLDVHVNTTIYHN